MSLFHTLPQHPWETLDRLIGLCLGFANCEEFDEGKCDGEVCYSGSRGCEGSFFKQKGKKHFIFFKKKDLQCFVEGRCVGVLLDEEAAEDEEECLVGFNSTSWIYFLVKEYNVACTSTV